MPLLVATILGHGWGKIFSTGNTDVRPVREKGETSFG
jgi:hypothetical protein